jgi:hypothetical protein
VSFPSKKSCRPLKHIACLTVSVQMPLAAPPFGERGRSFPAPGLPDYIFMAAGFMLPFAGTT